MKIIDLLSKELIGKFVRIYDLETAKKLINISCLEAGYDEDSGLLFEYENGSTQRFYMYSDYFVVERWSDYKLIWVDHWYDWELDGVCEKDGKRYYFSCANQRIVPNPNPDPEDEDDKEMLARIFEIYDPPAEAWEKIDECHNDFCKWVGTHFNINTNEGRRARGKYEPTGNEELFYTKWPRDGKPERTNPAWLVGYADSALDEL